MDASCESARREGWGDLLRRADGWGRESERESEAAALRNQGHDGREPESAWGMGGVGDIEAAPTSVAVGLRVLGTVASHEPTKSTLRPSRIHGGSALWRIRVVHN